MTNTNSPASFETTTARPYEDLLQLHGSQRHRFPLTEALCKAVDVEIERCALIVRNLAAQYVTDLDRARRDSVPSIWE